MRTASIILLGWISILAALPTPVPAKSPVQKPDEKPASSGCTAYEQTADGTWTALPCRETGSGGQTGQKPSTRGADEADH